MWPPKQKKIAEGLWIDRGMVFLNRSSAALLPEKAFENLKTMFDKNRALRAKPGHVQFAALLTGNKEIMYKPEFPEVPLSDFLMEHQKLAVRYALGNLKNGLSGALLALDQGLGKTIIALEVFVRGGFEKVVVLAPKSVVQHWVHEAKNYYGLKLQVPGKPHELYEHTLVATNYEFLKRNGVEIKPLEPNTLLVLDEATKVKNTSADITKAVQKFRGKAFVLSLTGTPYENDLLELLTILNITYDTFMYEWIFHKFFSVFEEIVVNGARRKIRTASRNLKTFRKLVQPFMYRKRKDQVLQLPSRSIELIKVPLSDTQEVLIDIVQEYAANKFRHSKGAAKLAIFTVVRRIEDDPRLIRLGDSEYKDLPKIKLMELDYGPKLPVLRDIVEQHYKTVVFTEFEDMAYLIREYLEDVVEIFVITGQTQKRQEIINRFKDCKDRAILIGTDAIAHGVNLQFADAMVNYDVPWNPAVRLQRLDRIYRIGATSDKKVYDLVADGLEQKVYSVIVSKSREFVYVVDGEDDVKGRLSKLLDKTFVNYWYERKRRRRAPKPQPKLFGGWKP